MGTSQSVKSQLQARPQSNQNAIGVTIKSLLDAPAMKKRFENVLKDRAPQYMSSIINLVQSDTNLQRCDPMTVIGSCMVAATLNLPVDRNLGYAWVIPYGAKAQFQLGYKGYIQLALRTAQYKSINVIPIHEGELIAWNPLTEDIHIDFTSKTSEQVLGYAAYFELLNGFKKTVYWTIEDVIAHRDRFSKQAKGQVWQNDFDAMAMKTVLKNMLAKWGILSVEMQKALTDDDNTVQATVDGDTVTIDIDYTEDTATQETSATSEPGANVDGTPDLGLPTDSELPF